VVGGVVELARRGFVRIEERPASRRGSRTFVVRRETAMGRREAHERLAAHEQAILNSVFTRKGPTEDEVEMSAVRGRLTSGSDAITAAVRQELRDAGLLDPDRLRARRRMMFAGALVLSAGIVSVLPAIPFARPYGGWPFLIALALCASSAAGFLFAAAIPAQTDEGLRQGAHWRHYAARLHRASAKDASVPVSSDELPYAVAFGEASAYAEALTRRGLSVPAWFQAASVAPDQQHAALVALMAGGAMSGDGGAAGAGGGGGAAGGGSSSAS